MYEGHVVYQGGNIMSDVNLPTGLVAEDTKDRSIRTFVQGLISSVVVGVLPLIYTAVSAGVDHVNWSTLAVAAITAALMTAISAVMAKVSPSTVLTRVYQESKVV